MQAMISTTKAKDEIAIGTAVSQHVPLNRTDKRLGWHLEHLDAMRGLAVLGVICIHGAQFIPGMGYYFLLSGQRGVQLFFVVSAFTLFLSYDNRKSEKHPTLNFFIRRYLRLAPMYYVALVLGQLLSPVLRGTRGDLILSTLLLHGLRERTIVRGVFGGWSMADEAMFYLCLPALYRIVRSFRSSVLVLLCIVVPTALVSHVLAVRTGEAHWGFYLFTWFPAEFPVFLMGIVAYFFWKEYLRDGVATRLAKPTSVLLLLVVVSIYFNSLPVSDWKLVPSSVACPMLLIAVLLYPWKLLVNRVTIYLGKISYSIYLLHFFWLWVIFPKIAAHYNLPWQSAPHMTLKMLALIPTVALLTIPVADLTWRFIETPGIRLGRWLISHWEVRKPNAPLIQRPVAETPDAQF